MLISSFFTRGGMPALSLTPNITIWEIQEFANTKVIDIQLMIEIGDGFYKYSFATYNSTKEYLFISDGGDTLPPNERFGTNGTDTTVVSPASVDDIVDKVWDESAIDHLLIGSTGAFLNETHADAQQLRLDVILAMNLLRTLIKYDHNRTKIDHIAGTLTVYDDNGVTPIVVFDLKDRTGVFNINEVFERLPRP